MNDFHVMNKKSQPNNFNFHKREILPTSQVLREFKNTLFETENLVNKLTSQRFYDGKYNFYDKNKRRNDVFLSGNEDIFIDENYGSGDDNDIVDDSGGGWRNNYLCCYDNNDVLKSDNFKKQKENSWGKNIVNIKVTSKSQQISQLKSTNDLLKSSNDSLKNQIKILSEEINTYKTQSSNLSGNICSTYDLSFQRFVSSVKKDLETSVSNNEKLVNFTTEILSKNKKLYEENLLLGQKYRELSEKIDDLNTKKATAKIYNEENVKRIHDLEMVKNGLEKKMEGLNMTLLELKEKESNLNLLKNSKLSERLSDEQILSGLKSTLNHLSKNNKETIENLKEKEEFFSDKKEYFDKEFQINSLSDLVQKMMVEKEDLVKVNENLRNEIKINEKKREEESVKFDELLDRNNKLNIDNAKVKAALNEKDEEIMRLTEIIKNFSCNLEESNE